MNLYIFENKFIPEDLRSSGATKFVKSGISPYQNIHNSFAAVNDNGGWVTVPPVILISYRPPPVGSGSGFGAATLRHTHNISAAIHREYELKTGSSRGSPVAFGLSP